MYVENVCHGTVCERNVCERNQKIKMILHKTLDALIKNKRPYAWVRAPPKARHRVRHQKACHGVRP